MLEVLLFDGDGKEIYCSIRRDVPKEREISEDGSIIDKVEYIEQKNCNKYNAMLSGLLSCADALRAHGILNDNGEVVYIKKEFKSFPYKILSDPEKQKIQVLDIENMNDVFFFKNENTGIYALFLAEKTTDSAYPEYIFKVLNKLTRNIKFNDDVLKTCMNSNDDLLKKTPENNLIIKTIDRLTQNLTYDVFKEDIERIKRKEKPKFLLFSN